MGSGLTLPAGCRSVCAMPCPLVVWSNRPRPRTAVLLRVARWTGFLLLASLVPALARAQTVRAWMPPNSDSLLVWSTEAKARFRASQGDSVGGDNYRAYELVGIAGRRLLRSLDGDWLHAPLVESALDSLGLDVHLALDPAQPGFVLLMVRNPYRWTARAVGFMYWKRGDDLRMQGAEFRGGLHPSMRVWWTGDRNAPYEWGVIEEGASPQVLRFSLFQLDAVGSSWALRQDEDTWPVLGGAGEATWADLDRDGRPELVSWLRADTDSLFTECADCPHLLTERTYVEGRDGFEFLDERLLPSPYTTFVAFVRLLHDHNLTAAGRLLEQPDKVREAVALGFGDQHGRGTWSVEYGEPGVRWPRWLELRFAGRGAPRRYVVHFVAHAGHWLVRDWYEPHANTAGGSRVAIPATPPTRPPARRAPRAARRPGG
jgi:hypothetical protein